MSSKACTEPGFGRPVGAELAIPVWHIVWQYATQTVQAAMPQSQMMAVMIMVAATLIIPCHTLSGVLNTSQPGASVTRLFIAWALHPGSLDLLHSRSPMSCSFYVSSHAFPSAKLNLSIQELTLGTHGLPDEHIEVCKWCLEDIRLYIQLKPICKWLREKLSDSVEELIIQFSGHQLSRGQTLITHHHSRWRYYVTGDALPEKMNDACRLVQFAITYEVQPLLNACVHRLETAADLTIALMTMRSCKHSHPVAYEAHKRLRREWVRRFDAGDEVARTSLLDATRTI